MSEVKNKNYSFRAVAFSGKLFSVIAATMLLLLVDGAIHDAPAPTDNYLTTENYISEWESANQKLLEGIRSFTTDAPAPSTQQTQQYPVTLESHHQRLQALSEKAGLKMDPNQFAMSLESHRERLQYLEGMAGIKTIDRLDNISLESQNQRLEALEQAFANNPPVTQTGSKKYSIDPKTDKLSVQDDLLTNGINPTETPYPMAVCNAFLVNGQNICTDNNVTAVVAALAVGLITGIVYIVQTEINNKQNTDKQIENSKNLYTLLLLAQQKSGGSGSGSTCTASQRAQGFC